jgi:hemerythrin-like metal-binding protein
MPLITWSDEYSIGNAELDNHHKKLIEILNGLYDNINKDCNQMMVSTMDELYNYAKVHFSEEEAYMKNLNYDGLYRHIVEHNKFIDNLLELDLSYKNSCVDTKQETVEFLWEWLMNHIINEDKKISR